MIIPVPDAGLEWADRILLRVEVGSTAHGTGLPGTEDYDELGVMALPWQGSIGLPILPVRAETNTYRPGRAQGERSQAGDYDLVVHSTRKFASLAATGNPSVLMVLFGPLRFSHPNGLGDWLRSDEMAHAFWHQSARARFLGYAKAQRERLEGIRGGAHTNRPELVDVHGYDTKYAMHMCRLGIQGIEYMATGRMTLPIPGEAGDVLRSIRRGELSKADVLEFAAENEHALTEMGSPAPELPDWKVINEWLLAAFDWSRWSARQP